MAGDQVIAARLERDSTRAEEYDKKYPPKAGKKRNKEQAAEYSRQYREKNKEKAKESLRQWREKNRERILEQRRASYSFNKYKAWREKMLAEDPEYFNKKNAATRSAPDYKAKVRAKALKAKYGLTTEQYESMHAAQKGACRICGAVSKRVLSVDHCHKTGKVRELLCVKCNTLVGHVEANEGLLEKIAEYLTRHGTAK